MDTSKLTRVEVIDDTGRVFSKWQQKVVLLVQDDGKTLKIFLTDDPTAATSPKRTRPYVSLAAKVEAGWFTRVRKHYSNHGP